LLKDRKKVHFIGIGGYGMSGLARVLLHLGFQVTGSDLKRSEITDKLTRQGAVIHIGHDARYLGQAELVVYSTAIAADNPEIAAAIASGLPIWHRSELLAHFLNARFGIAIAGAHGKTTTTSMAAFVLAKCGLDPTAFIGGVLGEFDGNARVGQSELLVAEADESDNSFLRYHPSIAVVTNIEPDHLEHYNNDFNLLLDAYKKFLNNIKPGGCAILFADDIHLQQIRPSHLGCIVTYSIRSPADYRATDLEKTGWGTRFTVMHQGTLLGEITLRVPGTHNVENALAAIAVAGQLNVSFADIKAGLEEFSGAKRRFQFLLCEKGYTVVDDYAHHPTEVGATLDAACYGISKRVIVVFQPHRYSRTRLFMDEFARSLAKADKIYLHKVYAASETPLAGVDSVELAARTRNLGADVVQIDDATEMAVQVVADARPGDLIISMGAGDITEIGHAIAARLREKFNAD
jgi:UDP-N-acetylmuramate--alanine ligase